MVEENLFGLLIILIAALFAGQFFEKKLRQSALIGELLVGMVLGPGILGVINPDKSEAIKLLAEIGILLFLFEAGLETHIEHLLRHLKTALLVALIGVFTPLLLGFFTFFLLGSSLTLALFIGAMMTATSVGITIRVLSDLKRIATPEGRIILGAAVIDDILGLILLSVVINLAQGGGISAFEIVKITTLSLIVMVAVVFLGIKLVPLVLKILGAGEARKVLRLFSIGFCLALAILVKEVGMALIVGAFLAGLILGRSKEKEYIVEDTRAYADWLGPIFFISIGTLFDPHVLFSWHSLLFVLLLFVLAALGKVVAGLGAIKSGADIWSVGTGMIPRGEVGLVFLAAGAMAGLLDKELYGILLTVIVLTTFITPLVLKPLIMRKYKNHKVV